GWGAGLPVVPAQRGASLRVSPAGRALAGVAWGGRKSGEARANAGRAASADDDIGSAVGAVGAVGAVRSRCPRVALVSLRPLNTTRADRVPGDESLALLAGARQPQHAGRFARAGAARCA